MQTQGRSGAAPLIGVNVPWLEGEYGHDFGNNINTPDWHPIVNEQKLTELLLTLKEHGVNTLRMWLFEQGEGLLLSNGLVTGLDEEFRAGLQLLNSILKKTSQRVYVVLLDMNSIARNGDKLTESIILDPAVRSSFLHYALQPALTILKDVLWGVDVCNEPEGLPTREYHPYIKSMYNLPVMAGNLHWQTVIAALKVLVRFTRQLALTDKVTIGVGYTEGVNAAYRYRQIGHLLPVIDYHLYEPLADVGRLDADIGDHQHLIIGELGTHDPVTEASRTEWLRIQEIILLRLECLVSAQVDAIFLWYITSKQSVDPYSLIFQGESSPVLYRLGHLLKEGALRAS
jgi:hypothetical protein